MKISKEYPPNYERICAVIPAVRLNPGIIFTYGDTLYVPSGSDIPDHLMAHEETHGRQQKALGVDVWWEHYLADPEFRKSQELEAYRNQYRILCSDHPRPYRRQWLTKITGDLAGPMYGKLITKLEAKKLIIEDNQS